MWTDYNYLSILESELIPALGCTEPIAIAYASAKARAVLGELPEHLDLFCSGNIVKNVKGVTVPNSGGLKGIDVAGALGTVCGADQQELEVLEQATPADVEKALQLIAEGFVHCHLAEGVENLYIRALATAGPHSAEVTIVDYHTFISEIRKDGKLLLQQSSIGGSKPDKKTLSVAGILDYADTVPVEVVRPLLKKQVEMNNAIAKEGLAHPYGAQVGRTLLETEGSALHVSARAKAAAASDARMGGCSLPVVINSGSGNQGITVCVPVVEYAKALNAGEEKLYRALLISNLLAIHIKRHIGSLSAFCGAVSAACGAGAAITYLHGGTQEQISNTIINTLGNASGIVCDGAKASCAAKIACALEAAELGHQMSMNGLCFPAFSGILQGDVEQTIQSIGYLGRVGMKETDVDILHIMLGDVTFNKNSAACAGGGS